MNHLSDSQLESIMAQERAGVPPLKIKVPAAVPRRKMSREESQMQCALLKWWQMQCRLFGVPELMLFSIPNGGGRSGPIVGSILKAEGLRKGAPDLFLAVGRLYRPASTTGDFSTTEYTKNIYNGLFLELKRREGVVSPEQEVFHELLRKQGYRVEVIRELQQGINVITAYLTQ